MSLAQWKREVWPTLSEEQKQAIREEVKSLRANGWSLEEAWIQAACTC